MAIETFSEKVLNAVAKKKVPLFVLAGGFLLFAAAYFTYSYIAVQSGKKAEDMEYAAFAAYSKKNQMTGGGQEKQIKVAIDLYQKIVSTYPKTKSAAIAAFYLGNAYTDLKEYDKGIDYYQRALAYSIKDAMRGVVNLRLGYAYLNKNDKEEALKIFGQVEKNKLAKNQDLASFEIGQIYENQGKKNEALGQYETLVKAFPSSPLSAEASARITSLKGPGVVTVAPTTAVK